MPTISTAALAARERSTIAPRFFSVAAEFDDDDSRLHACDQFVDPRKTPTGGLSADARIDDLVVVVLSAQPSVEQLHPPGVALQAILGREAVAEDQDDRDAGFGRTRRRNCGRRQDEGSHRREQQAREDGPEGKSSPVRRDEGGRMHVEGLRSR
jgi:hypothetical protein